MRQPCSAPLLAVLLAALLGQAAPGRAADVGGVQVPDIEQVNGKSLHLNGAGRRTYSFLEIHIYVASLYLEHPSADPDQIIRSPETKLLEVTFERDIGAEDARSSWRIGFANNCLAPCHLPPAETDAFIAGVPAMHKGDRFRLLFQQNKATITVNDQPIGMVTDPQLADAILATFLGPKPASPSLRQALLTGHS